MTDGFTPVEATPTTICSSCKHQVRERVTACPACGSTEVHTSTVRHFPGGRMMRKGHIAETHDYSEGPGEDPPISTG